MTDAMERLPKEYAAIGDDVGTMPSRKGKLVVKVDMLVEGTDIPRGMSWRQAARKVVAMCVSDFAAKGVKPEAFLVSLGVRRGVATGKVKELARGFRDAAQEWGIFLIGGDTNESTELVIDCAMLGFAKRVVPRDGARPGDTLVVTGEFGYPPAGLEVIAGRAKGKKAFVDRAKESVVRPSPSLEVGLAIAPYLSSSMDSSDGLARSLHTLARSSKVGFILKSLPVGEGVREFAHSNHLDLQRLVLGGGEEYLIVGTVKRNSFRAAARAVARAGGKLIKIGSVTSSGRVQMVSGRRTLTIGDLGWTHLG